jgi:hypothetical protein
MAGTGHASTYSGQLLLVLDTLVLIFKLDARTLLNGTLVALRESRYSGYTACTI